MSLSTLSHSDVDILIELRRNERSLWDVTSPHYSNARLARFLFSFTKMLSAHNEIVAADAAADNNCVRHIRKCRLTKNYCYYLLAR